MASANPKETVLGLLEGYILGVLGSLGPAAEADLMRTLEQLRGSGARARAAGKGRRPATETPWRVQVRELFGLTEEVDTEVERVWAQAVRFAEGRNETLKPEDFARLLVEENFEDAVEMVATEFVNRASPGRAGKRRPQSA